VFRFGGGGKKKRGFVAVIRYKPCTQISRSTDGSAPRTAATTAHASRGWSSAHRRMAACGSLAVLRSD
jgi:hypothetical protein